MKRTLVVILSWLCLSPALAQSPAPAAPGLRDVKLLVVLPRDDAPYQVRKLTRGDFVRGLVLTGILPALIGEAAVSSRSDPLEKNFNAVMQGYVRSAGFDAALRKSFAKRTRGVEVFAPQTTTDSGRYFEGRKDHQLSPAAAAEGFDYVLQLEPTFVGLITLDGAQAAAGTMSPMFDTGYRLYDARTTKQIHRGSASGHGLEGRDATGLATDRAHFELVWPNICIVIADLITGDLNRQDHLHAMARSVGRGDEVPAIESVLAKYAKKVRWKMQPANGWRELKINPFVRALEPKDATRQILGIRFEVEALVPEFNADVASVAEYLPVLQRNRLLMYPDSTPLQTFEDISAPGFDAYVSDLPTGARHVYLIRKVSDDFIEIAMLVFVKDFDTLYPAHRALMERMVAASEIISR